MKSNEDAINSLYDQFFISENFASPNMKNRAKEEIAWINSKISLSNLSKILDAGCGAGRHLEALIHLGYSPYGVDLSKACVEQARNNCPEIREKIVNSDLLDFSALNENSFDLVYAAGVDQPGVLLPITLLTIHSQAS